VFVFSRDLTFEVTDPCKRRAAPIARVRVDRAVRRHPLPPAIDNAKKMACENYHFLRLGRIADSDCAMGMRILV
jgi:hypothetical protein